MLAVSLRHRDAKEPVTLIARHLGVGRSTFYRGHRRDIANAEHCMRAESLTG